jgi:hypothetical protein
MLSHLRLPQPEGPGPCIYIPQEQGGPVPFFSPLTTRRDYSGGILSCFYTGQPGSLSVVYLTYVHPRIIEDQVCSDAVHL